MRRKVVTFLRESRVTLSEGGALLHLSAGTLRTWQRRGKRGELVPRQLGRPGYGCPRAAIREIRDLFREVGPEVGVEYLKAKLWWVPRATIERVIRASKREIRRGLLARMQMLWWEEPGRAWSCDWTDPGVPIDGREGTVFAVRDLASGRNLQSLPARAQSGHLATRVLEHQFLLHGAPLLLKTDGGSEFKEEGIATLLSRYGVTHLVSPGHYPQYNGAIEAGIGSLKTHAWYEAARRGRLGWWTCDDVEAGRLKANEISRPWGRSGPSPDEKWHSRRAVSAEERAAFQQVLAERRTRYVRLMERDGLTSKEVERLAITRALQECGYLVITRRGVSPRVSS